MNAISEPKAFRNGVQFAFDSTSIKLAEECLRKYQYKMIEGWSDPLGSPHLRFGSVYATALEHYHKHRALGMEHLDAMVEVTQEALISTWDYDTCELCLGTGEIEGADKGGVWTCVECKGSGKSGGKPWLSLHNLKTRENCIRTIIWYLEEFRDDPAKVVMLSENKPAVEHSFVLPVDDDIVFSGHLDKLVDYSDNLMVMDQKTTGSTISARFFDQFKPDIQMSMYTFAGKIIYQMPVKGVIIDAAQIAVGFTRFERGMTFRTDSELQEFYETTMATIARARHATEMEHFPMNRTACQNYGGCEFRKVCSKAPDIRKNFLKADFVQGVRWDPLQAR